MTKFSELGLSEPLMRAVSAKYDTPTPIQAQAIPALLEGRDLCGIAQTGTGKTAAFALPSLDYFAKNPKPRQPGTCRMLVLSPTRELSAQIADSFRTYGRFMNIRVETVFGGVPIPRQKKAMGMGCDVLVATPGRLLDLIDQRALHLRGVEVFVLDEADQMMDMGFIHAVKKIAALLPKDRQSLFFSATMPKDIEALSRQFLTDPVKVAVAPQATTAERVQQFVTYVGQREKPALLVLDIQRDQPERALIFSRTKHGADRIVRQLAASGIQAVAIHGNKSQPQRTAALQAFRHGHVTLLVATDIAARGIDVSGVSHVYNFDLPNVPEQYVHRIGRTARAGAEGIAVSYCNHDDERAYLRDIERLTKVQLDKRDLPEAFAEAVAKMPKPAAPQSGGARGEGRGEGRGAGRGGRSGGNAESRSGERRDRGGERYGRSGGGGRPNGQRSDGQRGEGRIEGRNENTGRGSFDPRGRQEEGRREEGGHNHGQPRGKRPFHGRRNKSGVGTHKSAVKRVG